jgi:putative DNA-invertase from lambdoid prophage Rac
LLHAYARVSTLTQSGPDKTSIAEQLAKCKAVASLRGPIGKYDFMTHSDSGVSGSVPLNDRPAGKDMLDQLHPGDIVLAAKMDRIFRSGVDALATVEKFKKQKIGLILCDIGIEPVADSPVATMFFSMLAAFAQFERERICERIAEGKKAKAAKGGLSGGPVPFGFSKVGEGPKAILVPNEIEQEHIRAAKYYATHAKRKSRPTQIARLMADEGMLGRDGKPYHRATIFKMIRTPIANEVSA